MDAISSTSGNENTRAKVEEDEEEDDEKVVYWQQAKKGIQLLINNQSVEAQELFESQPDSMQMYAGRCFTVFIDAIMTFEEDKLNAAHDVLKQAEQRCMPDIGWVKSMKARVFGVADVTPASLEQQIIFADANMCLATLTFLQQDSAGYLKGGWTLRKAWKCYQQAYGDIQAIYRRVVGELELPEPQISHPESSKQFKDTPSTQEKEATSAFRSSGYTIPHSLSDFPIHSPSTCNNNNSKTMKKSISHHTTLHHRQGTTKSLLASFTSYINLFASAQPKIIDIDKETATRLMGAIAFGYGLFQLGISLLPPSILRVMNFFGFGGDRQSGVANLMYARGGQDMRAPLASLALLWYHTIVRPFYCLDGGNVQAGVAEALQLIDESVMDYPHSALFLFFRGRVNRLQSNITSALLDFEASMNNAAQREIKILSMHEVGWCHLIQRNFTQAEGVFQTLKSSSRWSRPFYAYLSVINAGARGNLTHMALVDDVRATVEKSAKVLQLEDFIYRRMRTFPRNDVELQKANSIFWRLLVYELLYLWNVLTNCSADDLMAIIDDCTHARVEPMTGLAKLIQGCCESIVGNVANGRLCFEKCITKRKSKMNNCADAHISAFCQYELGSLLLRQSETQEEGKQLLQQMTVYKNFDFEQRLNVRTHTALKQFAASC